MSGPAPTPTEILRARGSWRANKNKREPRPPSGRPSCPSWMNKEAKRVWKQIIPLLDEMRVLTLADRDAITRYCTTFARWRQAEEFLQVHGDTYPIKNKLGEVVGFKNFPQVRVADRLATQLVRLEQAFGLTPSARSRIQTNPSGEAKSNQKEGAIRFFVGQGA